MQNTQVQRYGLALSVGSRRVNFCVKVETEFSLQSITAKKKKRMMDNVQKN
jgi:hypothetical protein